MKQSDSHNNDYQEGLVIAEMRVTKLANGMTKASSMGLEVSSYNQEKAVLELQDKLQAAFSSGELRPDGM